MAPQPLTALARSVAQILLERRMRIVFAESCTAGLVSATLARLPGISEFHCGSAVVYRLETKSAWLDVPADLLANPGPVSEPVARAMADGVLRHTPESQIAAAVTGHLGPGAPPEQDGLVFVAVTIRGQAPHIREYRLPSLRDLAQTPVPFPGESERELRQWAAVELVLSQVVSVLSETTAAIS